MVWHIYLRNRTAFIPTLAQTEAGFFLDVDPVGVVSAIDTEALQQAIKQAIGRGNPKVPTPTRAAFPKPGRAQILEGKVLACLRKGLFKLVDKDGGYHVKQGRRRPDRGWEDDPERTEPLPPGTGIDEVAQRVSSSVQTALAAQEESRST